MNWLNIMKDAVSKVLCLGVYDESIGEFRKSFCGDSLAGSHPMLQIKKVDWDYFLYFFLIAQ